MPDQPVVSVIVLVTESTARLRRCLASIFGNADGRALEVLVVANGTSDEQLAWLTERDDIVLLRAAVNLGFGDGCRWAVETARSERFLFMNDDAVATGGWLDALNRALEDDERIGVAGSRVLLANGTLQEAGAVIWSDGTTSGVGRGMSPGHARFQATRDVDYVSFCSAMVRRATWEEVGGFDPRYFPAYYEDADFCCAARLRGWRVVVAAGSTVLHDEGASAGAGFRDFLKRRNRRLFVNKWRSLLDAQEPRPRLAHGQGSVARALGRHKASAGVPVYNATLLEAATVAPAAGAGPGTVDGELRYLRRLLDLQTEYSHSLDAQLASLTAASVIRHQYRALRGLGGRFLRRHPRLSDRVRSLVVSVGNGG